MSFEKNDPRFTAYILGELSAKEQQEFESFLAENLDANEFLQELKLTTNILNSELKLDAEEAKSFQLTDEQRERIISAKKKSIFSLRFISVFSAVAAIFIAVVGGVYILQRPIYSMKQRGDQLNVKIESTGKHIGAVGKKDQDGRSSYRREAPIGDKKVVKVKERKAVPKRLRTTRRGGAVKSREKLGYNTDSGVLEVFGKKGSQARLKKTYSGSGELVGLADSATGVMARSNKIMAPPQAPAENLGQREGYNSITENAFKKTIEHPLSTFSIDVDTGSYSNIRRMLSYNQLPPKDAVRIEEMINYFSYDYKSPSNEAFAVNHELTKAPWNKKHYLMRIGIKAKVISNKKRPASNLVFLLDVSGSMNQANKLPLLKRSFQMLVNKLNTKDRVAIVVYAGASGLVLESTPGSQAGTIMNALDKLSAGGSTNGGAGIELAYKIAKENFIKGGVNRVILATDGDFNVGVTGQGSLVEMVKEKAKGGVFLSVMGFGMGNYQDGMLEQIANKGNGNYAYIDNDKEAKKVFMQQLSGTLVTVAKDVKIQIEFNPANVSGYRLIGYENRMLAKEDFNDDKKDAGEIGAGHTVTALYEIVPAGTSMPTPNVDELRYQAKAKKKKALEKKNVDSKALSDELLLVKIRHKKPDGKKSVLIEVPVKNNAKDFSSASTDLKFQASVAGFGMLLRSSKHKGTSSYQKVMNWGESGLGADKFGYRGEYLNLVKKAKSLQAK